ncbi:hypothetical protein CDV31_007973 [Fusarium ambrosium]|uniref:C2H2-type domain-containing protein n=1 Tax=Fusarium ambrosium TaxID=131363 RepID=A0A428U3I3_9HYPO|nr:hypothetical protein CDV31_007973 [Fusarium ambrosium]
MTTNQCTCLAFFPTIELLEEHLQDLQAQKEYHSAQVQRCRRHRRADDNGHDHARDTTDDPNPKLRSCPFKGCSRGKDFSTKQHLDRHFETHVECNEVCVFCIKKTFMLVSEFVRHAKQHSDERDNIKVGYMNAICERLKEKSAKEFRAAKLNIHSMQTTLEAGDMKRKQDAADLGEPIHRPKRIMGAHPLQNDSQAVHDAPPRPTVMPFVPCVTNETPMYIHGFNNQQPSLIDDILSPHLN